MFYGPIILDFHRSWAEVYDIFPTNMQLPCAGDIPKSDIRSVHIGFRKSLSSSTKNL